MRWDVYWHDRTDGGHRRATRAFLQLEAAEKLFHLDGGETLLDFGCGAGELLEFFVARYRATGVDFSETMLSAARARFAAADLPEPALLHADDVTMWRQLSGQRFDRITAAAVVQYLDETQLLDFLEGARDHLSGAGRVVLFDVIDPRPLYLYERGALTTGSAMPSLPLLMRRSLGVTARRAIRRTRNEPARELGVAHAPEAMQAIGEAAGFDDCRIVRSMYYEYRYHALFSTPTPAPDTAPADAGGSP